MVIKEKQDKKIPGSYLLSHAVTHAVPSAYEGLASVFGMVTGVAPQLLPPGILPLATNRKRSNFNNKRSQVL